MSEERPEQTRRRRRYLGVWDPTGGEVRKGSGLPVEEGEENVRILCHDPELGARGIPPENLADALGRPGAAVWIDVVRPRELTREILTSVLGLPPLNPGDALAYEVLDALVDEHLPAVKQLAEAAEDLEASLDPGREKTSVAALGGLLDLRRDLSSFRRLAVAQQDVLRRMRRISTQMREHLSDAVDNQREAIDMADATRDYVEGAVEASGATREAGSASAASPSSPRSSARSRSSPGSTARTSRRSTAPGVRSGSRSSSGRRWFSRCSRCGFCTAGA